MQRPRSIIDFYYLNEIFLRIQAAYDHSCLYEIIPVEIIEFISVTMAFTYPGALISLTGSRVRHKDAGICTKTHCPALILSFLVRHYMYYRMSGFLIELSAVSLIESCHMPCKFNDRALHTETYSEKRYFMLPRILNCSYFPLNTPVAESSLNNSNLH